MNHFFDIDEKTIGIRLTGRFVLCLFDREDLELLKQYRFQICTHGYIQCKRKKTNDKLIMVHNLLMNPEKGMEVDHINGNKADNRKINYRICTHAQNMKNKRPKKGKKYKGVYRDSSVTLRSERYFVQIRINGENKRVGYYKTEKSAAVAYNEAAKKYFGEFAYLNVIEN